VIQCGIQAVGLRRRERPVAGRRWQAFGYGTMASFAVLQHVLDGVAG
jgi:hypothetical protein